MSGSAPTVEPALKSLPYRPKDLREWRCPRLQWLCDGRWAHDATHVHGLPTKAVMQAKAILVGTVNQVEKERARQRRKRTKKATRDGKKKLPWSEDESENEAREGSGGGGDSGCGSSGAGSSGASVVGGGGGSGCGSSGAGSSGASVVGGQKCKKKLPWSEDESENEAGEGSGGGGDSGCGSSGAGSSGASVVGGGGDSGCGSSGAGSSGASVVGGQKCKKKLPWSEDESENEAGEGSGGGGDSGCGSSGRGQQRCLRGGRWWRLRMRQQWRGQQRCLRGGRPKVQEEAAME